MENLSDFFKALFEEKKSNTIKKIILNKSIYYKLVKAIDKWSLSDKKMMAIYGVLVELDDSIKGVKFVTVKKR